MQEQYPLTELSDIEWRLSQRLLDPEFRKEFFRAELETSVPEDFKSLRERRELTQAELAELVGTKQSGISRFEKSTDAAWQFDFLRRMAEAMDARLRVVVEAFEDVIGEYEEPEQRASALADFEAKPIGQQEGSPWGMQLGKANEARKRGEQSNNFASLSQGREGNSVWPARPQRRGRTLQLPALP